MMVWEIIGHVGGFLIAISLLPQLVKAYKTKSTKDLSLLWTLVLLIGLLLYAIYATKNNVVPLMVFASVEFFMVLILIFLKITYENPKNINKHRKN